MNKRACDYLELVRSEDFRATLEAREAELREERARARAEALAEIERMKPAKWRAAHCYAVPIVGAEQVFGELERTHALEAVLRWLPRCTERGLCLRGPVGTGKSIAAAYAVRAWTEPQAAESEHSVKPQLRAGFPVAWLHPDELVSAVMHAYDEKAPTLHRRVVIDDMGRETKPDFQEALCRLLDAADGPGDAPRERAPHVVLITTNMTRAQMRDRYEPRVISRLGHRCVAVDVRGPDLRGDGGF